MTGRHILTVASLGVLLLACGGSDDDASTADGSTATPSVAAASATTTTATSATTAVTTDAPATTAAPATAASTAVTEPAATTTAAASSATTAPVGTPAVGAAAPMSATVDISDFEFVEAEVKVAVGGTVTWTNNDDADHTATGDDGFDTGTITSGQSATVTFDTAGSFPYACGLHPFMAGSVVVG